MSVATDIAVDTRMCVVVSKEIGAAVFTVLLAHEELHYWDDDPMPDIVENTLGETIIAAPLPLLFDAVDKWLLRDHHVRALPHSWHVGECGGTSGYEAFFEAVALPARPIATPRPTPDVLPPSIVGLQR